MLNQPTQRVLQAIESLNRDHDFAILKDWLHDNLDYVGRQAIYSNGVIKDEYSGAYKAIETLMGIFSLEQFKVPPEIDKRFE